ncbi:hypothetical protein [Streptomyces sp. LN500]|uniref:hypothetical protein n=1 Tax=Streptomyces sp. LN500 TaxID=3112978 RepID=UPI00372077AE
MRYTIARRTALAVASAALTAAGLLTTGGSASAVPAPHIDASASVSRSVQPADLQNRDDHQVHVDNAQWIQDQIAWTRTHNRDDHQVHVDNAQWVQDQIAWTRTHA